MLEMIVTDVFEFSDGGTVFMVHVEGGRPWIPKCACSLVSDDATLAEFEIEGEMLPKRTPASPEERSVSTRARVNVDRDLVRSGKVHLICEEIA